MSTKKDDRINFESALSELEALVEKMESGELSLEQSLEEFERGMKLSANCQQALQEAELKVQTISARYQKSEADSENE